ncbi:phosphate acyltransferase, partial [Lacrimispora sp.]
MFENMVDALKAQKRKIVFTEGTDPRILEAASRLFKDGVLTPVLLGNPGEIDAAAREYGWPVDGIEKIDPLNYEGSDEMAAKMVELRKGKMDEAACRAALEKANYFGTMLVKMGKAD